MVAAILRYFVARLRYRIKMFSVSLIISKLTSRLRSSILNSVLRHRDGNRNESQGEWVSVKLWNPPIIIVIFVFSWRGLLVAERDWWHRSRRTNVQILLRFVKRKNNDARQAGNLCIARFRCGDQPLRLPLVSRYHPFSPCFRRTRFRFRVDAHVRHLPFLYSPFCHPLSLLEPLHSPSSISLSLSLQRCSLFGRSMDNMDIPEGTRSSQFACSYLRVTDCNCIKLQFCSAKNALFSLSKYVTHTAPACVY